MKCLAVHPDGTRIVSGGKDSKVIIWDAESGDVIHTIRGHAAAINCVAFSPTGDRIATASDDKTIKLWDAETGEEISAITGHKGSVLCVAFSPDGNRLVSTCHSDKSVRIWTQSPVNKSPSFAMIERKRATRHSVPTVHVW